MILNNYGSLNFWIKFVLLVPVIAFQKITPNILFCFIL